MKVEQLEKDIDVIFSERAEGMFFIRVCECKMKSYNRRDHNEFKPCEAISDIQVKTIPIDELEFHINDDRYALIKVS